MTGAVLVLAVSLAILAFLAFAVSAVAFLVQTSMHKPFRSWLAAAGASLVLVLVVRRPLQHGTTSPDIVM